MNITRETKKEEAIARMKLMGIFKGAIKQFKDEDLVNQSEPPMGACYWVNEDIRAAIKKFEEEKDALVYHVFFMPTQFGDLYAFMYVEDNEEYWEESREGCKMLEPLAYVYNTTDPWCSELGTIGLKRVTGGLIREW